jgi:hypothetical protein
MVKFIRSGRGDNHPRHSRCANVGAVRDASVEATGRVRAAFDSAGNGTGSARVKFGAGSVWRDGHDLRLLERA